MMKSLQVFSNQALRNKMLWIAIPIALQNLITYCTSMMDTVMLGQLGEIELSGAAAANQFTNIFLGICFGISSGTNVLLAQYWGKQDSESMRRILSIMYWVTTILALLFCVLAIQFPAQIVSFFVPDDAVIEAGSRYLRILSYSYIGMGLSSVMLMTLRSVGTVKISVIVYSVSLVVNSALNYALIFGKFGAPELGIEGAAIATCIARSLEGIIAIIYVFFKEKNIKLKPIDLVKLDLSFLKDISKTTFPIIINELIWMTGYSMVVSIMGRMGRAFITANTITSLAVQLNIIFVRGVCDATSVSIGNALGAGDFKLARAISRGVMTLSVFLGVFAGVLVYLIRPIIISFYNIPDETKDITMAVMASASIIIVFSTVSVLQFMGILRGGGDTFFVLVSDVIFMWTLAIPLGALAGLYFGLSPAIVYLILKVDEVGKIILGTRRILSDKWLRNLTR